MSAAYAQDRIEVGDKLTFHLGVRYDEQWIENDIMERVNEYGEWAPRASVVYDIKADGKMLVRGSAGRYYHNIGLGIVFQEFTRGNNGENFSSQFLWNPATQLYDRFQRRVEPSSSDDVAGIEPYYKEEVSVGFDWQFADNWIFTSRAVVHESDDIFHASLQFDAEGQVFRDLRNWPNNVREYEGLSFQVNRAFRNNWSLQSNLSISNTDGTIQSSSDNDNHNEGFGGIEVGTGILNTTSSPFWDGPLTWDREIMVNIVGIKRWVFGNHDLMTSAFLKYTAGEPWALHPSTRVAHPVSGQTISTTTFREPRGSQQLEDFWMLNLNATYQGCSRLRARCRALSAARLPTPPTSRLWSGSTGGTADRTPRSGLSSSRGSFASRSVSASRQRRGRLGLAEISRHRRAAAGVFLMCERLAPATERRPCHGASRTFGRSARRAPRSGGWHRFASLTRFGARVDH